MRRRLRTLGPWPSLTTRGRGFISAGISILACALIMGQRDLTRLGVLILALPVLAILVNLFRRPRLTARRSLETQQQANRAAVGEPAVVTLAIWNDGRRIDSLLAQETVPQQLGGSPRFSVESLFGGDKRSVTYTITPSARGRFELGPLAVSLTEPLGLATVRRRAGTATPITVYPQVVSLEPSLAAASAGVGDDASSMSAQAGTLALSVREYRHGDDLRRVHWRSTARLGDLMVRADEQSITHRATVLLDNRFQSYRLPRRGGIAPFEWAVSLTASVCQDMMLHGYDVNLVTQDSQGRPVAYENDHLEVLAELPLTRAQEPLGRLMSVIPQDHGPVITAIGAVTDDDALSLAALTGTRVAFHLSPHDDHHHVAQILRHAGWVIVPVGDETGVAAAWAAAMSSAAAPSATRFGGRA